MLGYDGTVCLATANEISPAWALVLMADTGQNVQASREDGRNGNMLSHLEQRHLE